MNIGTDELLPRAWKNRIAVHGFNIPYLPMLEPIVQALRDSDAFGLIMVARLEWMKFETQSVKAVAEEYHRVKDERFTRLHLDHVPVIDEDNLRVDYLPVIRNAINAGYQSVMIDGSRLPLADNIAATRQVVELAYSAGVAVEGELGAVMGQWGQRGSGECNNSQPVAGGGLAPGDKLLSSGTAERQCQSRKAVTIGVIGND